MKVFDFAPADYRAQYADQGWVHIPRGVTVDFHEYLLDFVERRLSTQRLEGMAGVGDKEQAVLEFPDDVDYPDEIFDVIADLCGLKRATMTLSERHIKAYEADADPEPVAHKDRYPSQVSVGLSITIPEESRLILYPDDHREPNPFNSAAELRASLQPDQQPEVALKTAREVELADHERDVLVFPGAATWHLRRRGARVVNLYLKVNDFGSDPLGEDPRTAELRARTLQVVRDGEDLDAHLLVRSRRLDTVGQVFTRSWEETYRVQIYGEPSFGITGLQFEALRAADGTPRLDDVVARVSPGGDAQRARAEIILLAERGALDLVPAN